MSNSTESNGLIGERPAPLEVDMAMWGDRMVETAPTPGQGATDATAGVQKPIAVALNAQDVGRMYAANYSPYMFMQEVLEKLKAAGAPIEGTIRLRVAHGAVARVKPNLDNGAVFQYLWLDESYVAGMQEFAKQQKAMGFFS
jgi:hypothetical protein